MKQEFRTELERLINFHSKENGSDTPDFILAEYLESCLAAYDKAVTLREIWSGRAKPELRPTPSPPAHEQARGILANLCPTCNGRGELEDSGDPSTGYGPVNVECRRCDGRGTI
jgi:hypothetical protein